MDENGATARGERHVQGIFEDEICCGDEVDLHKHVACCEKNPGHKNFIPVNQFAVGHLPTQYRDDSIVKLIRALADITVRISIRYTSKKKPVPDKSYPPSSCRKGSGWVWRVNVFSNYSYNNKTCPCKSCRSSCRPETQWAVIEIYTATHLFKDEEEDAETTCHFFYDSSDINLNEIPSVSGATHVESNDDSDWCRLTYIIHDINLGYKLNNKWRLYRQLHSEVGEKYNQEEKDGQMSADNDHRLTIIVSHPHGCSKMISIGEFTQRHEMKYNDAYTWYSYTTATCTGSSGAPVYVLSRWWWWACDHPHRGQLKNDKALNYSGVAMY